MNGNISILITKASKAPDQTMNQVFVLIKAIDKKLRLYFDLTGRSPETISISPLSYRQLLETRAKCERVDNQMMGCRRIDAVETPFGNVRLMIDELLLDTEVDVA